MFLSFSVAQLVQLLFVVPYISLEDIVASNGQIDIFSLMPKNILLLSIGASSLFMFVGGPWLYTKILDIRFQSVFSFQKGSVLSFFLVLILVLTFMPLNSFVFEINSKIPFPQYLIDMEKQMAELTKSITQFDNVFGMLIGIVVIAIFAGLGEELTFRGIFQNLFNKIFNHNYHLAIWTTAFLFSAIHFQFLGFFPRMLLGALFGYIYYWSGNLVLAMFAHFVNNGFTVLMVHLHNIKAVDIDLDSNESMPWQTVLASIICSSLILILLYKSFNNNSIKHSHDR